jgi:hypothetical protein
MIRNPKSEKTFEKVFPGRPESHLGGFNIDGDLWTYEIDLIKEFVNEFSVTSVVDLGCGMGYQLDYIIDDLKLTNSLGIEGHPYAVENNLQKNNVILHDFCSGPCNCVNGKQFDLAWSSEFLEHIPEKDLPNVIHIFKKSKFLMFTCAVPGQGGHHHVNCQNSDYWINTLKNNGFTFLSDKTIKYRNIAKYPYFKETGLIFKNNQL